MSTPTSGLPPAGWYADPSSGELERWWDGTAWTSHERALPALEAPALVVAGPAPAPAAPATEPQPQPQPETQTLAFDPTAAAAALRSSRVSEPEHQFAPPHTGATVHFGASTHNISSAPRDAPHRWGTFSVWLLVLWPVAMTIIWTVTIVAIVLLATIAGSPELSLLPVLVTCAGLALLPLLWATRDRNILKAYGYQRPAHWAWMFLSPLAYLIARYVRTRAEAGRGSIPLWVHASLIVVWVVGVNAVALLVDPAPFVSRTIVTSIEQGIENGAAQNGVTVVAHCPDDESVFVANKSFECVVTVPDGQRAFITVTWGENYWETPTVSDLIFGDPGVTN